MVVELGTPATGNSKYSGSGVRDRYSCSGIQNWRTRNIEGL